MLAGAAGDLEFETPRRQVAPKNVQNWLTVASRDRRYKWGITSLAISAS